jgi:hypothetical protein
MIAFAMLRKGQPKIMDALIYPLVSKTTKSAGTYEHSTRTQMSLRIHLG